MSIDQLLSHDTRAWIDSKGGNEWVAKTLEQLRTREIVIAKSKGDFGLEVMKAVVSGIKSALNDHGGELLAGSVAKRVAQRLWGAWGPAYSLDETIPDEPMELLVFLEERGVRFSHHERKFLNYDGPREIIVPAVRKAITKNKSALLKLLFDRNKHEQK